MDYLNSVISLVPVISFGIQVPEKRTATATITVGQENTDSSPVVLRWDSKFRKDELLCLLLSIYLLCQARCPKILSMPWFGKWENWCTKRIDPNLGNALVWTNSNQKKEGWAWRHLLISRHLLSHLCSDTWDIHPSEEESDQVTYPPAYTKPWGS